MSKRKEKEDIKMTIFIMVAGIALMVLGVFGIVTSRIEKKEYAASTDIRKVSAVIVDFSTHDSKDDNGDVDYTTYKFKFRMKLTERPIKESAKNVFGQEISQKDMHTIN